jgi:hypothetical protein
MQGLFSGLANAPKTGVLKLTMSPQQALCDMKYHFGKR